MNLSRLVGLTTAAGALALAGCHGADGNAGSNDKTATAVDTASAFGPDTTATASLAPPDASGAVPGTALPLTAQAFVDAAASSDLYEMDAAKLADAETHPTAIRSFAQMMMRDHAKSSAALKAAVGAENNSAQIDTQKLLPEHQAMLAELKAAPPEQFAAVYARQQVAAHEKTLAVLQTYAKSGDSHPLMAFATKVIPVVQHHLEAARKLPQQ